MKKVIKEYVAYQMYDDMLNDCYEDVSICGYEYSPARALMLVDEIAYHVGFNDWSSQIEDEYEIDFS